MLALIRRFFDLPTELQVKYAEELGIAGAKRMSSRDRAREIGRWIADNEKRPRSDQVIVI